MFFLYSLILTVGFIIMSPIFLLRREKYLSGFWQRFGYLPEFVQNRQPVLWIHCVSVGEANAARPLIDEIKREFPHQRLIVSTTTRAGQEHAKNIFKDQAETVFYFPFDWKFTVRRALDHFKPKTVLLMETELWFNFIREANEDGVVLAVINGRISEKSSKNYLRIRNFVRRILRRIDLALMQTQADAKRLMHLGIRPAKVKVTGNIKFDQRFEASDLTEYFRRRFKISPEAPLIVAASTHAPEEKWILEAFKAIFKNSTEKLPRLLLAPRHPERFAEVADLIKATGFAWARRSENESERDGAAEIMLLDCIGELRAVYPLAETVFVGGSLMPHGGQSVLEPALAGRAIITGFHTENFAAVVDEFKDKNALVQLPEMSVKDEKTIVEKLVENITELLDDAEMRHSFGANALGVMEKNRGATERTIENLRPFLQTPSKK